MAIANLLEVLSTNPSGLRECIFYGRLRCFIETPSFLSRLQTDGTGQYALFDTFAVKCVNQDWFQSYNNGSIHSMYYTKGSILVYTNRADLIGEYCKVGGRNVSRGVTVKQQRGAGRTSGITAFAFTKEGANWVVLQNQLIKIGESESALRSPDMMDFVVKNMMSDNPSGEMEFPEAMDSVLEYSGVDNYVEISTEVAMEGATQFHESTGDKIDVSKIDLKLTYHMSGIEKPEIYYAVEEEIEQQARARSRYAKELFKEATDLNNQVGNNLYSIVEEIRSRFISNVVCKIAENIGNSRVKGRFYLDQLLNTATISTFESDTKETMSDKDLSQLKDKVISDPWYFTNSEAPTRFYNPVSFAIAVIGISTGIGYDGLLRNYKSIQRVGKMSVDDWFAVLLLNPYMLSMMGSSISVVDADVIFYTYTKFFTRDIEGVNTNVWDMRNDLLYLKGMESCCDKDSMVAKNILKDYERKGTYAGSRFLKTNGFPVKADLVALLTVLMGKNIMLSGSEVRNLISGNWYTVKRTNSLTERGLIDDVDGELMLGKDLEKEFLIFKVFQEKGMCETGITDAACDDAIVSYEEEIGFKLEPLQKSGIHLTKYQAAVLSGCAGSGKTTTSACMTQCLLDNLEGYKMIYCTPTGKASRRLAEVVGGGVKTCHSQFRIGVGLGESYLLKVDKKFNANNKKDEEENVRGHIYIIDESGMLNRDVLFEIARSIKDEDLIYFLGDVKQLPPIGVGVPFYMLMQILPCVELGVNKRAAEGSLVNYNTTLINCMSDGVVEELLFDKNSFLCTECSDEDIQRRVVKSFLDWMSGAIDGVKHDESEVQVITGYTSTKYNFSSTCLNPLLQVRLRANDRLLFKHGDMSFYKNDRVLHINSNLYGMPRYVAIGENKYEEVATLGVINGEMGIIDGIVDSATIDIIELDDPESLVAGQGHYENVTEDALKEILDTREDYSDRIISMKDYVDDGVYFVKMRVYDVDLKKDVYIFYNGRASHKDESLCLQGSNLDNLDLAYALTCHKMQGSQTPIAIIPIGSTCNPSFINRNMLNTMITRSQGLVELVGTIKSQDSPLNRGRMEVSKFKTDCLLQVLCDAAREE